MDAAQDQSKKGQPMRGAWDSIHVVEVKEHNNKAKYKLTSTIMLAIDTSTDQTGSVSLAGSLTRQVRTCDFLFRFLSFQLFRFFSFLNTFYAPLLFFPSCLLSLN